MLRSLMKWRKKPYPSLQRLKTSSTKSSLFSCVNCGMEYSKWQGKCHHCGAWESIEYSKAPRTRELNKVRPWLRKTHRPNVPVPLDEIDASEQIHKYRLPDRELNWVFGGGIMPGSLTLLSGSPGIGKSTLALQIAGMLSTSLQSNVVYISGEESTAQIKQRGVRLALDQTHLYLASSTDIDEIVGFLQPTFEEDKDPILPFNAAVVDSIQTIYDPEIPSAAGSINQVKECTLRLLRTAKEHNVPIILIGHITKSGEIAGPKVLEHIVDTVMNLEGDPHTPNRFLRCVKNRFGNTSEVGVFSMTKNGLEPLDNPLCAFLPDNLMAQDGNIIDEPTEGVALTITIEGTRPIPVEIQALSGKIAQDSEYAQQRARCRGLPFDKIQLICAVLSRRSGVAFNFRSLFVNVGGGYSVSEPAADLSIAIAIASTVSNRAVVPRTIAFGEITLAGELREVSGTEIRLSAAHKLGFKRCILPPSRSPATKALIDQYSQYMEILETKTLSAALTHALIH